VSAAAVAPVRRVPADQQDSSERLVVAPLAPTWSQLEPGIGVVVAAGLGEDGVAVGT
jgi:hypothetical protein